MPREAQGNCPLATNVGPEMGLMLGEGRRPGKKKAQDRIPLNLPFRSQEEKGGK